MAYRSPDCAVRQPFAYLALLDGGEVIGQAKDFVNG
jgi:hypothetical protein